MKETISNRTSIGNTTNPALRVVSLVAAFDIPERTSLMTDDKKYSSKKDLSMVANQINQRSRAAEEYQQL
ncbi:MAG: hypothetical protein J6Q51_01775 [Clostridia bacterium]|nr:hypothetical protein [Clostridia bacterium]